MLRSVLSRFDPGLASGMEQAAQLLDAPQPTSLRELAARSQQIRRVHAAPLKLLQQNMGLLVAPAPYLGTDRTKAVQALVANLRSETPDVVGLSECWADGERDDIHNGVKDLYPFRHEGPDEGDLESDGGLFMLSRHPFSATHQTIYRQCAGEDCLTNKGVLHARIGVAGHPTEYDIFLTHMQSCPPKVSVPNVGPGNCEHKLRVLQVAQLSAFVQAYSSPRRPAFLMGDLNHNGFDMAVYGELLARLENPSDAWILAGDGGSGITSDSASAFEPESPARPSNDPARGAVGTRLDYLLTWHAELSRPDVLLSPSLAEAEVLRWETSPGRDLSDHYGLRVRQTALREIADEGGTVQGVTVRLTGFLCLTETGGPVPIASEKAGSDEVRFKLSVEPAQGPVPSPVQTAVIESIDSGSRHNFVAPVTLSIGDPGASLGIKIEGTELDLGPFGIQTGAQQLGPETLKLDRAELVRLRGRTSRRTLPLLLGGGGEYAAYIEISVT